MESLTPGTQINNDYVVKSKLNENDLSSSYIVGYRGDKKNYYLKLYKKRDISDINIDVQFHKDLPEEFEYKIYHVGTYSGYPFFVRNFFPGQTLKEYIDDKVLSEDEVFDIFQCIYKKLNMLHSHDRVHFDLKPSNIIVKKRLGNYDVKLIDFNCIDPFKTNREFRNIISTLQFTAPEFILTSDIEHPFMCDYYSLGAVLFYMLFKSAPINPKDLNSYVAFLKRFNLDDYLKSVKDERIKTNLRQLLTVDPGDRYAYSYVNNILPVMTKPRENFSPTTLRVILIVKYSKFADKKLLQSLTATSGEEFETIVDGLTYQGVIGKRGKYYNAQLTIDLPKRDLASLSDGVLSYKFEDEKVDHVLLANTNEAIGDYPKALFHWQKSVFSRFMNLSVPDKKNILLHLVKEREVFNINDKLNLLLTWKLAKIFAEQGEFNKSFHLYKTVIGRAENGQLSKKTLIKLSLNAAEAALASRKPSVALKFATKARKYNSVYKSFNRQKYLEYSFLTKFLEVEVGYLCSFNVSVFEYIKLFRYLKYEHLKKYASQYSFTKALKPIVANIISGNSKIYRKYAIQFLSLRNDLNSNIVRGVHYHLSVLPFFKTKKIGLQVTALYLNKAFRFYSLTDVNPYYPLIALHMLAFVSVVRGKHDDLFATAKHLGHLNAYAKANFSNHARLYMDYFNLVSQNLAMDAPEDSILFESKLLSTTKTERVSWLFLKARLFQYRGNIDEAISTFEKFKDELSDNRYLRLWHDQFVTLMHVELLFKVYESNAYSREVRLKNLKKLKTLRGKVLKYSSYKGLSAICFRLLAKYAMLDLRSEKALECLNTAIEIAASQDFPLEEALSCIEKSIILRSSDVQESEKFLNRGCMVLKKNRLNLIFDSYRDAFSSLDSSSGDSGIKMQERLILDKIKLIQQKTSIIKDEEQLLKEILDTAIETLNGERGVLILRNKENPEKYDFALARDCFKKTISDYSGNISRNILYNASISDDPTILEDATLAEDFSQYKSVRLNKLKSVLTIPLIYKGVKKGILYIDNNEIPGIFNEDIVELAKHFAISVCAVLENLERVNAIAELNSNVELINQKFIDSSELFTLGKVHPLTMHDLKSYLSYILFGIDDLKDELKKRYSDNDEFLSEIIDRLKNSVSVINKHINSNNALVSRGKTVDFESLSSEYILDDILEFISPFSEKEKIDVQFIDKIEQPITFTGNRYLLNNVFINILINALDALRVPMDVGKIIRLEMESTDYTIRFRISNNGPAIDDHLKGKIFSPFISSKKSSSSNSGLGLYISEKIVEYHKGEIYLDDSHEMTSFVIELTADG